jgi:predicted DsbA family dithiol-disulfide isomerase
MATGTRTAKTSSDLKKEIEATKARLAVLEKRAYAEELTELIANTGIVKDFAAIKAKTKDISDLVILAAIASAVGIKRLEMKQGDVIPRKPSVKKTTAPK